MHLVEPRVAGNDERPDSVDTNAPFRRVYKGTLICAGGFTAQLGADAVASGACVQRSARGKGDGEGDRGQPARHLSLALPSSDSLPAPITPPHTHTHTPALPQATATSSATAATTWPTPTCRGASSWARRSTNMTGVRSIHRALRDTQTTQLWTSTRRARPSWRRRPTETSGIAAAVVLLGCARMPRHPHPTRNKYSCYSSSALATFGNRRPFCIPKHPIPCILFLPQ